MRPTSRATVHRSATKAMPTMAVVPAVLEVLAVRIWVPMATPADVPAMEMATEMAVTPVDVQEVRIWDLVDIPVVVQEVRI